MHRQLNCRLSIILILLGLLSACAGTQKSQQVLDYEKSNADYSAIVQRIKLQTASAEDYDLLIRVFPLTSFYEPDNKREQATRMMSQNFMQRQYWKRCFDANNVLLSSNYTSLSGHYGASVCATELGKLDVGKFHNKVLDNFIEAIWRTGTGKTPDSPFYITSVDDLYAFVQLHQLVVASQSLTYINDLPIQAISVQNPETRRSFTWYFNVTPQFRRGVIDDLEQR